MVPEPPSRSPLSVALAGQYKQMVQNGGKIEEFKNSQEDGEGAPLTRSAILPDLGWGELTNPRLPCLPCGRGGRPGPSRKLGPGQGG